MNAAAQERAQTLQVEDWGNGTTGQATGTTGQAELCKVYYFHTDQVGMPQELSNSQGQLVWQASYKTWGSTVAEEWEVKSLAGQQVHSLDQGDIPKSEEEKQQNLRFQGQYLDRETGLHYNTFRFYDADIGRFISPDPIGLNGGINLLSYSPNPISWIDPWGLAHNPVIFPDSKVIVEVEINAQGSRDLDFKAANEEAGYKGKRGQATARAHDVVHGKGNTVWHHATYDPATNKMRMQLVTVADHNATIPHRGSVADFMDWWKLKPAKYGDTIVQLKAKALNALNKC